MPAQEGAPSWERYRERYRVRQRYRERYRVGEQYREQYRSCYRPQAFIFFRHRLHTQILALPPSPPPHTALPLLAGRSGETPVQEGTVSASYRLDHALILLAPNVRIFPPSASHINTGLSPTPALTHSSATSRLAGRSRDPRHRRALSEHRIVLAMPSSCRPHLC